MSALALKADMCGATWYVRFGPIADISRYAARECAHDKHTWQLMETPGHSAYGFSGTSPAAIVMVVPKSIWECELLVSLCLRS